MKKKLVSVLAAAALAFSLAVPALAAPWQPSKTVKEIGAASATITTSSGTTAGVEVTVTAKTGADGKVESVKASTSAYIKVTPHSETQQANAALDIQLPSLRYAEKSGENTDSGLSYSDNDHVNLVYETVTKSTSTTEFLSKIGSALLDKVAEAVQELADEGAEETVDDYQPAALFDVTASAGAIEQMGADGQVDVELEVPGVKGDTKLVAIHFLGQLPDIEAAREALNSDFANALLNYDAEILPSVPGNGTVTVTMTSFSPVMILTKAETEPEATAAPVAGTEATPEPEATAEPTVEPESDNGGNGWLWAALVVAVLAIGGGAYASTRKKKTTAAAGKK